MKHLSPREIALVSSPLLIVAVVGFLLARRKPPTPDAGKLHMEFHVETPTAPEAFHGAEAAFVVKLKGKDADAMHIGTNLSFWELQTATAIYSSRNGKDNPRLRHDVLKSNINGTRFLVNLKSIPPVLCVSVWI